MQETVYRCDGCGKIVQDGTNGKVREESNSILLIEVGWSGVIATGHAEVLIRSVSSAPAVYCYDCIIYALNEAEQKVGREQEEHRADRVEQCPIGFGRAEESETHPQNHDKMIEPMFPRSFLSWIKKKTGQPAVDISGCAQDAQIHQGDLEEWMKKVPGQTALDISSRLHLLKLEKDRLQRVISGCGDGSFKTRNEKELDSVLHAIGIGEEMLRAIKL